jgi:hypothetical protein
MKPLDLGLQAAIDLLGKLAQESEHWEDKERLWYAKARLETRLEADGLHPTKR